MISGLHLLLTYRCTSECDHCFLYCGPRAEGTFTLPALEAALAQARDLPSVEWIFFEGGEPFLFYPLMLEGIRLARSLGFRVGVVTNAYWASAERDAELWLRPLKELGVEDLSVSEDLFHGSEGEESPARRARAAALKIGLPSGTICIGQPAVQGPDEAAGPKGQPVVGGAVLFRGRAADKLVEGLPRFPREQFSECPHEELRTPDRLHLDPMGNLHICQGIVIGNVWQVPLTEILAGYDPDSHPIVGPLIRGGPAQLAREYAMELPAGFVDACHLCFLARRALLDRYPLQLAPPQVSGV